MSIHTELTIDQLAAVVGGGAKEDELRRKAEELRILQQAAADALKAAGQATSDAARRQ